MTLVEERRPGPTALTLVGATLIWHRLGDVCGAWCFRTARRSDLGTGPHPGTARPVSDGPMLYWISAGFEGVSAMPVAGGDVTAFPVTLPKGMKSTGQGAIAVSKTSIFLEGAGSALDSSHPETAALISVAMADGTAQVLARVPSGTTGGLNVVLDSDSIFWTSAGLKVGKKATGATIHEYSLTDKTNEPVHELAPGNTIQAIAGDPKFIYVSVGGATPADGWIGRISKRTRTLSTLVEHVNAPFIALDEDSVYFTSPDTKSLSRVAKTGGTPDVLWHGDDRPEDVVVDGKYAYWINRTNMSIMRIRKN